MNIYDFEGYLFDMDGVIANSNPTHKIAFQQFLATQDIDCTDAFFETHIAGNHNPAIIKNILQDQATPEIIVEWGAAKEALWRSIFAQQPETIAGVIPFIQKLYSLGKKMAVCTSAPIENLNFLLDLFEIRQYFSVTLCEQDVITHKPSPEVYLKASELLQVVPTKAVVFEDSEKGAAAGLAAGCSVVTINNDKLIGAPYYAAIKNFKEII